MSANRWWMRPDDLPQTQPDATELRRAGKAAIAGWLDLRTAAPGTAWRFAWASRASLLRYGLLRVHSVLDEVTNLLLPPLFTMIAVNLAAGSPPTFGPLNLVFSAFFFAEWSMGLVLARSARAYLGNAWLLADLASSLPLATVFQALRFTRLGRLVRLVKVLHVMRARRFSFPWGKVARAAGVAMSIAGAGAIALRTMEPQTVAHWPDALWWSMVTMSTVGYGDIAPVTAGGRAVAVALMVTSVGVFSYLAGLMATALFDPEEDAAAASMARLEAKLDAVLARLPDSPGQEDTR